MANLAYAMGSVFIGIAGFQLGSTILVVAAIWFLIGSLAQYKEYSDEGQEGGKEVS